MSKSALPAVAAVTAASSTFCATGISMGSDLIQIGAIPENAAELFSNPLALTAVLTAGGLIVAADLWNAVSSNKSANRAESDHTAATHLLLRILSDTTELRRRAPYAGVLIDEIERSGLPPEDVTFDLAADDPAYPALALYRAARAGEARLHAEIENLSRRFDAHAAATAAATGASTDALGHLLHFTDQTARAQLEFLESNHRALLDLIAASTQAIQDRLARHTEALRDGLHDVTQRLDQIHHAQTEQLTVSRQTLEIVRGLAAAGPAVRRVPHQLPPAANTFFGRGVPLAALTARLLQRQSLSVVGPPGLGKTALAAKAITDAFGHTPNATSAKLFPDGIVFLDLYASETNLADCWGRIANSLIDPAFAETALPEARARAACDGRHFLLVIEGAEEANGHDVRPQLAELLRVLSPENRHLILTRDAAQGGTSPILLRDALDPEDAAGLLDSITASCPIPPEPRDHLLALLAGHPLAITWAGGLLSHGDEHPAVLVHAWESESLPSLCDPDPGKTNHTLGWLFTRSADLLDAASRHMLHATGLLSRSSFPLHLVDGLPGIPDTRAALKALTRASLLRIAGEEDHWEFTHVLGYQFARASVLSDDEERKGLARTLGTSLARSLYRGLRSSRDFIEVAVHVRLIPHASTLLESAHPPELWEELTGPLLYDIRDLLRDRGQVVHVETLLRAVEGWLDHAPQDDPDWLRERFVCQGCFGDFSRLRGDLAEAGRRYLEVLQINKQLSTSNPRDTGWKRDLWVSLIRLGNVAASQRLLDDATQYYTASLAIAEELIADDPGNMRWQRDLYISHNSLGDVARDRGELEEAARRYVDCLELTANLVDADPDNKVWQRDLAICHERLGAVARDQDQLAEAARRYTAGLAIIDKLATSEPGNTNWQRDLAVCHTNLGDLALKQGLLGEAVSHYGDDLIIAEKLAAADSGNALWQRDLAISHMKVAFLAGARGRSTEQWNHWQAAYDILDDLSRRGLHLSPEDQLLLRWLADRFANDDASDFGLFAGARLKDVSPHGFTLWRGRE